MYQPALEQKACRASCFEHSPPLPRFRPPVTRKNWQRILHIFMGKRFFPFLYFFVCLFVCFVCFGFFPPFFISFKQQSKLSTSFHMALEVVLGAHRITGHLLNITDFSRFNSRIHLAFIIFPSLTKLWQPFLSPESVSRNKLSC